MLRNKILTALYKARKKAHKKAWLWRRELEQNAGTTLDFELDYLTERGFIKNDGAKFRITATGIDFIEENIV